MRLRVVLERVDTFDCGEVRETFGLLVLIDSSQRIESIFTPADAAAARVNGGTGLLCVIVGASRESFSVNEGITSVEADAVPLFNFVRERRLYGVWEESDDGGRTATGLMICIFEEDRLSLLLLEFVERVV